MKRARFSSFFLLLIGITALSGSGCKTTRSARTGNLDNASPSQLMEALLAGHIKADWLDAKAKITFNDGNQQLSVNASIKMRKDSLIWASIKKLGFEIARVQVTPDSVYIIDRINNEYAVRDLKYLEKQVSAPASLATLQALLLGNPLFFTTKDLQAEVKLPFYHLFGEKEGMENHYWLSADKRQLKKMDFNDLRERRSVSMGLEEYAKVTDRQDFSYLRNMEMQSSATGKVQVEVRFSEVVIDKPLDISFDIPDRYTRVK